MERCQPSSAITASLGGIVATVFTVQDATTYMFANCAPLLSFYQVFQHATLLPCFFSSSYMALGVFWRTGRMNIWIGNPEGGR